MKWMMVVVAGLAIGVACHAQPAQSAQERLEKLQLDLAAAEEQAKQAQAKRNALEDAVAQAKRQVIEEQVERARAGDEAAIRGVLDRLGASGVVVDYELARPFRGAGVDHARAMGLIREALKGESAVLRAKLCWVLGQNGSEAAAAVLRDILKSDKEADVIGGAIAALARCPDSPANVEAVQAHIADQRLLKVQIGYYARGSLNHQPLGLLAQEYVKERDAGKAATVAGELIVETPSLFCAGFQWRIEGDANRNCAVKVRYRKAGTQAWTEGMPLWRCRSWESGNPRYTFDVGNLLAGSIFNLEPGTAYEVELSLVDPDGGTASRTVQVTTRTEPPIYEGVRTLHVAPLDPAKSAGSGTKEDPFNGIAAADRAAQPGDVMLLAEGTYTGSVALARSGEAGKPIVWRGAAPGRVILDGSGKDECLGMSGVDHVQFENLTLIGAKQGCIKSFGCQHVVVRRCVFRDFGLHGLVAQGRPQRERSGQVVPARQAVNWFVLDNEVRGPKDWRKDRGSRTQFGINVSGTDHVIAFNRVEDCWDCISLSGSNGALPGTGSLDICYNDLRQGSDDGVEADYVFHNVRVYRNRLTNTFSSLSFQPVYGGPGYLLYNAMHNTGNKPFKLHVNATGTIIAHNTCTSSREAMNGSSCHDAWMMNNLLLGQRGEQGYWLEGQADPLWIDYTGYNVARPGALLKHNNVRYQTMSDFAEGTGQMKHAVRVDWDVFAKDARPEGYHVMGQPRSLELRAGSAAVDAGVVLPGINDGFAGAAPDLGCYEVGKPVPEYGPRK